MSELPEGWTTCKVEDAFNSFSGGTPSKNTPGYWNGGIPWISSGEFNSDLITFGTESITEEGLQNSSAKLCRPGSVIVVVRSGILKHTLPVAIVGKSLAINQDIKCFDSGDDDINRWLFLSLRTFAKEILSLNREGTTVQSVKYDTLKELELSVPPLNEQRRIVAKLEKLLGKVEACQQRLEKIPRILKRFRQAVLAAAFDKQRAQSLKRLDNIFIVQTGGTPDRKKAQFYMGGNIPWIKTGEVQNCDIRQSEEFITEEGLNNSNAKVFPPGTLLIAMYGEGKTRGQVGRLRIKAATNQACAALVNPKLSDTSNQYVFLFLLSQYHKLRSEAVGGNQPNLNLSIIKSWEVPFPSEDEQQETVRRVEALFKTADALEERYRKAKAHVDRLTQSILAKAFRGELVPTEAELARQEGRDYEPASALLERVRQERAQSKTAAKPPGKSRKRRDAATKGMFA
jgi:type I restriction enzyme, S subunit